MTLCIQGKVEYNYTYAPDIIVEFCAGVTESRIDCVFTQEYSLEKNLLQTQGWSNLITSHNG